MTTFPHKETVLIPIATVVRCMLLDVIMELPSLQITALKHLRHSIRNDSASPALNGQKRSVWRKAIIHNNPIKKGNNICAQTTRNHPTLLTAFSSM